MRSLQTLLASSCFLLTTIFVSASALAQSEEVENPPSIKLGFATAALSDGKLRFDFGSTGRTVKVVENVSQTYTVAVPYTEKVTKDGKEINITKMRHETRTRTVPVTRTKVISQQSFDLKELKFMRANGEKMELEEAEEQFESKRAVVVLPAGQELDEFYKMILREDAIIAVTPKKSEGK